MHEPILAAGPIVLATLCAMAAGQAPGELDFSPAMLPMVDVTPLLTQGAAPVVLTSPLALVGQNVELHAPLTIAAGGELRLVRSSLRVHGEVKVLAGGHLCVLDSELTLPNLYQNEHELRVEGGLLHSERATIGSGYSLNGLQQTRLLLLRGTWLARHTVVQGLVTTIGEGRTGWFGNPQWRGGTLVAKGLFEGDRADAVHFGGVGDGELVDGTMNVGLYIDVGAATAPTTSVIDLDARHPLTLVYGDPAVHTGVTNSVAASPVRIRLQNHRSPTWMFFATEATNAGPLQTLQLRHAENILCNLRGSDLVGSPQLAGPWASYYSELPGLPSTERPGHHSLPPGCSVRLGNVRFESGPNDWNHIFAWGLYLKGDNTNVSITGPTNLAELFATDADVQLSGSGSFDMGVFAETVRLYGNSVVTMTNVRLGDTTRGTGVVGLVEANGQSHCTLQDVRTGPVRLRTTSPQATITAGNVFEPQRIVQEQFGGAVTLQQATATQSTDLQNADFEQPLLAGGLPPHWQVVGGSGARIGSPAPGTSGAFCYEFLAAAPTASVGKVLTLPPATGVSVLGTAQVQGAPATGSAQFVAAHGSTTVSRAVDLTSNAWQRVLVPLLTTGPTTSTVTLQFASANTNAAVRLDDLRVVLGSWWDDDNLLNFDFDGRCRARGRAPDYWPEPDGWRSYQLLCEPDPTNLAPGAPANSQSLRVTLQGPIGNVYKQLGFLRPGDRVSVSGWVRVPNGSVQVLIGDGFTFYASTPPNIQSTPLGASLGWQQVTWPGTGVYVVPANPTFTRIDLTCQGPVGSQIWLDQFTVSIQ